MKFYDQKECVRGAQDFYVQKYFFRKGKLRSVARRRSIPLR